MIELEVTLVSDESDYGFIDKYIAVILLIDSRKSNKKLPIGQLISYVVDVGGACDHDVELSDLFDLNSDLTEIYSDLFDYEDDRINRDIAKNYDVSDDLKLFVIEKITIQQKYRGKELGLLAIQEMLSAYGYDCELAVLKAHPIIDDEEGNNTAESHIPKSCISKASQKLMNYYSKLGFVKYGPEQHMIKQL